MIPVSMKLVPVGTDAQYVRPGDFILCHRKGFASWAIRTGEALKGGQGSVVSHAAFVEGGRMGQDTMLIEALTKGVVRTPLTDYRQIEYWIVRTGLEGDDQAQAVNFARSCVGQEYGFATDAGIALRFMTPGHGLWFGMDGTQICSGLVAQAQVRGWVIYPFEPSSCAPSQLFDFYMQLSRASWIHP